MGVEVLTCIRLAFDTDLNDQIRLYTVLLIWLEETWLMYSLLSRRACDTDTHWFMGVKVLTYIRIAFDTDLNDQIRLYIFL